MGVCDFRSIDLTRDLIASDNILPHRIAETYNVLHNERHQWFYLKDQMPNEILVFKSFDSQPGVAISTSKKLYHMSLSCADPKESMPTCIIRFGDGE